MSVPSESYYEEDNAPGINPTSLILRRSHSNAPSALTDENFFDANLSSSDVGNI